MADICRIYGLIPTVETNKNLFWIDSDNNLITKYYLSSMILYGQKHYTCTFFNKEINMWSFVDDDKKKNFNSYHDLIKFLIKRRSIPVGIFFCSINIFNKLPKEKYLLNEEIFELWYKQSLEIDKSLEEEEENNKRNNIIYKTMVAPNNNNNQLRKNIGGFDLMNNNIDNNINNNMNNNKKNKTIIVIGNSNNNNFIQTSNKK